MSAAWIIFSNAVRQLAGPGTQRSRLASAISPAMRALKRKELPQERRDEFDQLFQLLGASLSTQRDVERAVERLSEPQLQLAVDFILSICDQLTRYEPLNLYFEAPAGSAGARHGERTRRPRCVKRPGEVQNGHR